MIDAFIWNIGTIILTIILIIATIHILQAYSTRIKLKDGVSGFEESKKFSEDGIDSLTQHYSRIQGTLLYWKNRAIFYKRLNSWAVFWSISTAVLVPIFLQFHNVAEPEANIFITELTAISALLIAISRGFKAEELHRAFRTSESDFYDARRRLLDRSESFGKTESEQISAYFERVEKIRKAARNAELNNPPTTNVI